MKTNAPIFYIFSQIGVFCIVYTLLLATHRTSFAIDFCAADYATKTAINVAKVVIFVALIHALGIAIAHRFAELSWRIAATPLFFALAFVALYYVNDMVLGASSAALCETGIPKADMRSIFRPEWQSGLLYWTTRFMAVGWGVASLFVLYKISKVPSDFYEQ